MLKKNYSYYLSILIILTGFISERVNAQTITEAEYFVDVDLGVGNNTPITLTNGPGGTIEENFIVGSRPVGSYVLFVRAKDDNGNWGFTEGRPFIVKDNNSIVFTPPAEINKMEYFIDNDPGHGLGIDIPITQSDLVEEPALLISSVSPVALTEGFHSIGFRTQNTDGVWGFYEVRSIIVKSNIGQVAPTVYDVSEIEYFFDDDPGVGLASPWPSFTSAAEVDFIQDLPEAAALSPGQHVLVTRAKNANGVWGFYERRQIIVKENIISTPSISPITKIEYYIDGVDPGVGNGQEIPITPSTLIDLNTVDVATSGTLIDGQHTITVRAMNEDGVWSMAEIDTFDVLDDCTQPITSFDAQLACAGSAVTFLNTSDSLQVDATYRWYLDGDAIIDETTQNASFTYPFPGTYVVALAVRQGTICLDSISTTIEIQPQPVAVFSTSGGVLNQLTNFVASATNLPAGSVWAWDFDGDFIIDSNVAGNTTFIYSSEGTFNPSLTITDSLGCFVTTTNIVAVSSTGGGPSAPIVDFVANNNCAGNSNAFIDISQNLPVGSTYSWDFDGDGNIDDTTVGNTNFTYTTAGSYDAILTIDLGGPTISSMQTIEILEIPEVIIEINANCYGQESQMIDLSQKVSPTATYSWDFQSDGIIDDTTAGNTNFTYPSYNSYIVNLKIDNGGNCFSSTATLVEFADSATPDFETNKLCEGEEVIFTNLSTNVNPAAIYSWDFDGDNLEDTAFPGSTAHVFSEAGTYNATLTIDNGGNCLAFKTIPLEVTAPPAVDLGPDKELCVASTVTFDPGVGYNAYLWPDGSTEQTFTVDEIGEYVLRVQDILQCFNTDTIAVKLLGPPVPSFTHSFDLNYDGIKVIFENTSSNATSYLWDFGEGPILVEDNSPIEIVLDGYSFYQETIYDVCLTALNDCDEITFCEQVFVSPTGDMVEAGNDVSIYPIPATEFVYVSIDPSVDIESISLVNAYGLALWTNQKAEKYQEIDLKGLAAGIYYVTIDTGEGTIFKKVMKE